MSLNVAHVAASLLITSIATVGMAKKANFDYEETLGKSYGTLMYRVTSATQSYIQNNTETLRNSPAFPVGSTTALSITIAQLKAAGLLDSNFPDTSPNGGQFQIMIQKRDTNSTPTSPVACAATRLNFCNLSARIWITAPMTSGKITAHAGTAFANASKNFAGISYDEIGPIKAVGWTQPNPVAGQKGIVMASTDHQTTEFDKYFRKSGADTLEGSLKMGGNSIENANTITLGRVAGTTPGTYMNGPTDTPVLKIESGNANIAGDTTTTGLNATGASTLNSMTVTNAAQLNGGATMTNATINNNVTVTGATTLNNTVNIPNLTSVTTSTDPNAVDPGKLLMVDSAGNVIKSSSSLKQFAIVNFKFENTKLDVVVYDTKIPVDQYTMIVTGRLVGVKIKITNGMTLYPEVLKAVPRMSPSIGKNTWWIVGDTSGAEWNIDSTGGNRWEVNTLVYANDMVVDRGCVTENGNNNTYELYYNFGVGNGRGAGTNPMNDTVRPCAY